MTKLKYSDIKKWKAANYTGYCDLCKEPLKLEEAVADHCHKTGNMRGILHRRCNSLEGVISRGLVRFGFKSSPIFLAVLEEYYKTAKKYDGEIHPTYFTPDERKERAKARAKKRKLK
jgi:hypothetical protein